MWPFKNKTKELELTVGELNAKLLDACAELSRTKEELKRLDKLLLKQKQGSCEHYFVAEKTPDHLIIEQLERITEDGEGSLSLSDYRERCALCGLSNEICRGDFLTRQHENAKRELDIYNGVTNG